MLLAWAEHCSPWSDDNPDRFVAFARRLIATPDADVSHMIATNWNCDYSHAPILWIIQQQTQTSRTKVVDTSGTACFAVS